jgi:hypothetical protein
MIEFRCIIRLFCLGYSNAGSDSGSSAEFAGIQIDLELPKVFLPLLKLLEDRRDSGGRGVAVSDLCSQLVAHGLQDSCQVSCVLGSDCIKAKP